MAKVVKTPKKVVRPEDQQVPGQDSGKTTTGGASKAGPQSHSVDTKAVEAFYDKATTNRFGPDRRKRMNVEQLTERVGADRLEQIIKNTDDPEVQALANDPEAGATPARVFKAWAHHLGSAQFDQATESFDESVGRATKILAELRSFGSFEIGNDVVVGGDFLDMLAKADPGLAFIKAMAAHEELGGTAVLTQALDRADLPKDIADGVKTQLATLGEVEDQRPETATPVEPKNPSLTVEHLTNPFHVDPRLLNEGKVAESFARGLESWGDDPDAFARRISAIVTEPGIARPLRRAAVSGVLDAIGVDASQRAEGVPSLTDLLAILDRVAGNDDGAPATEMLRDMLDLVRGDVRTAQYVLAHSQPRTLYDAEYSADTRQQLINGALDLHEKGKLEDDSPSRRTDELGLTLLLADPKARDAHLQGIATRVADFEESQLAELRSAYPSALLLGDALPAALRPPATTHAPDIPDALSGVKGGDELKELFERGSQAEVIGLMAEAGKKVLGSLSQTDSTLGSKMPKEDRGLHEDLFEALFNGASYDFEDQGMFSGSKKAINKGTGVGLAAFQVENDKLSVADAQATIAKALENDNPTAVAAMKRIADKLDLPALLKVAAEKASFPTAIAALHVCADKGVDVEAAAQQLMTRSESSSLFKFAGQSAEANLEHILAMDASNPLFFDLVQSLPLPATGLEQIAEKLSLDNEHPIEVARLLRRALDESVPAKALGRLAAVLCRHSGIDAVRTLRVLAAEGLDKKQGAELLSALEATDVDSELQSTFFQAAAELAAEGRLFEADDVLAAVERHIEAPPVQALTFAWMGDAGSLLSQGSASQVGSLLTALMQQDQLETFQREFPLEFSSGLRRAAEAKADFTLTGDQLVELLVRITPANASLAGQVAGNAIAATGQKPEAALTALFADDAVAQHGALAATTARLRAMQYLGKPTEAMLATALAGGDEAHMPAVDAIELGLHGSKLSDADRQRVFTAALQWAETSHEYQQDTLWLFEHAYRESQKLGPNVTEALTAALREVAADGGAWTQVRFAREILAGTELASMAPEIESLATGDPKEAAKAADRLVDQIKKSVNPNAAVDAVLGAVSARRPYAPTLAEVDSATGGVQASGGAKSQRPVASTANAPTQTFSFVGFDNIPAFEGQPVEGVEVPPSQRLKTDMPTVLRNYREAVETVLIDDQPTIALGDPATGKTAGFFELGHEGGYPVLRINGDPKMRLEQLEGRWVTKQGRLEYEPSLLMKVWANGGIIMVDEGNVCSDKIQEFFAKLAHDYVHEGATEVSMKNEMVNIPRNPNTRLVFTGNRDLEGTSPYIEKLNKACKIIQFDSMKVPELTSILKDEFSSLSPDSLERIAGFHAKFSDLSLRHKEKTPANIRTMKRVAERMEKFRGPSGLGDAELLARELREVYIDGVFNPQFRDALVEEFNNTFADVNIALEVDEASGTLQGATFPEASFYEPKIGSNTITIGDVTLPRLPGAVKALNELRLKLGKFDVPVVRDEAFNRIFYAAAKAWAMNDPVMVIGPDDVGAWTPIKALEQLTGLPRTSDTFTKGMQVKHLMGGLSIREVNQRAEEGDTTAKAMQKILADMPKDMPDNPADLFKLIMPAIEEAAKGGADAKPEMFAAPGLVGKVAESKNGGILGFRHFSDGPSEVLATLLAFLEKNQDNVREYRRPDGVKVRAHEHCYIAASTRAGNGTPLGISPALLNRFQPIAAPPLSEAVRTERFAAVAEDLDPRLVGVARKMVHFETLFQEIVWGRNTIAGESLRHIEKPKFESLVGWLHRYNRSLPDVQSGKKDAVEAFVDTAVSLYQVPEAFDDDKNEVERKLLGQLARGVAADKQDLIDSAMAGQLVG